MRFILFIFLIYAIFPIYSQKQVTQQQLEKWLDDLTIFRPGSELYENASINLRQSGEQGFLKLLEKLHQQQKLQLQQQKFLQRLKELKQQLTKQRNTLYQQGEQRINAQHRIIEDLKRNREIFYDQVREKNHKWQQQRDHLEEKILEFEELRKRLEIEIKNTKLRLLNESARKETGATPFLLEFLSLSLGSKDPDERKNALILLIDFAKNNKKTLLSLSIIYHNLTLPEWDRQLETVRLLDSPEMYPSSQYCNNILAKWWQQNLWSHHHKKSFQERYYKLKLALETRYWLFVEDACNNITYDTSPQQQLAICHLLAQYKITKHLSVLFALTKNKEPLIAQQAQMLLQETLGQDTTQAQAWWSQIQDFWLEDSVANLQLAKKLYKNHKITSAQTLIEWSQLLESILGIPVITSREITPLDLFTWQQDLTQLLAQNKIHLQFYHQILYIRYQNEKQNTLGFPDLPGLWYSLQDKISLDVKQQSIRRLVDLLNQKLEDQKIILLATPSPLKYDINVNDISMMDCLNIIAAKSLYNLSWCNGYVIVSDKVITPFYSNFETLLDRFSDPRNIYLIFRSSKEWQIEQQSVLEALMKVLNSTSRLTKVPIRCEWHLEEGVEAIALLNSSNLELTGNVFQVFNLLISINGLTYEIKSKFDGKSFVIEIHLKRRN